MAIILRKYAKDIFPQKAVSFKKDLPKENNRVNEVRYVKSEQTYYLFNGFSWQEVDLILE